MAPWNLDPSNPEHQKLLARINKASGLTLLEEYEVINKKENRVTKALDREKTTRINQESTNLYPESVFNQILLPYPPTLNKLYIPIKGGKVLSQEGKIYKAYVNTLCLREKLKPIFGEVVIVMWVYRPRQIGDLDNLNKIIFDSVKGSAYYDDKQVVEIHSHRLEDKNNPRVNFIVYRQGLKDYTQIARGVTHVTTHGTGTQTGAP